MKSFLASTTAPDWISTGIATLALLLAIASLYLQWRDKRPRLKLRRVKVEQRFRQLSYDPATDQSYGENQTVVVALVANVGDRPITLAKGSLRPLFGRSVEVGVTRDYGSPNIAADSSYEVHAFVQDALPNMGKMARRVGVYRFEVSDHMDRRWSSRFLRLTLSAPLSNAER